MKKKPVSKEVLEKILNKMPVHIKQKLAQAIREGKKVNLNIKAKKGVPSPYQTEE